MVEADSGEEMGSGLVDPSKESGSTHTAYEAGDYIVQLERERDALRKTLIRVGNHAHGMPPSKGAGYIIAEVNSALADLERRP